MYRNQSNFLKTKNTIENPRIKFNILAVKTEETNEIIKNINTKKAADSNKFHQELQNL